MQLAGLILLLTSILRTTEGTLTGSKATEDPCTKISGIRVVAPADALACYKSFPFNVTLRDNVVSAISRVFDFYTFEDYYYKSPPPFQDSTVNIRGELARMSQTHYTSDYEFNMDMYNFTTSLNDGHTIWYPNCYQIYENVLPAPIVILQEGGKQGVYVVPELVDILPLVGSDYLEYFTKLGFNWQRLAGSRVLEIEGQSAYDYIDHIARVQSGGFLDHGIRVNMVLSSYSIQNGAISQSFGLLAETIIIEKPGLHLKFIPANSTKAETVFVPYAAGYTGSTNFTDRATYWNANCVVLEGTNGEDLYPDSNALRSKKSIERNAMAKGDIHDVRKAIVADLPARFQPSITPVGNSTGGVVKSFILDGNATGVIFVGSFGDRDFARFQTDVHSAVTAMKSAGVSKLLIDVTNNPGGYVCLGQFLSTYITGTSIATYGGFQSSLRANPLAKKILRNQIARGTKDMQYSPDNFASLNGTVYPETYDYFNPVMPMVVNGRYDPTSQRHHNTCPPYNVAMPKQPPFSFANVAIVGNSFCASTCAQFTTLMVEKHDIKIAAVGGKPGEVMEYKGCAGYQVLDFDTLKSEIKTARLNDDPLAPPDLFVNGDMRVNWRTAWSYLDEDVPIAYKSEPVIYQFPYTAKTYSNPQALWEEAVRVLLP